jgi:hypothetical protein
MTFLNQTLPDLKDIREVSTRSSEEVAPGLRIAVEPQKGEIQIATGNHIGLSLARLDDAPKWSELAVVIPSPDWRKCRSIFLSYQVSGHGLHVRPALRTGYEEGFRDHFACDAHPITDELQCFCFEFFPSPRWFSDASWIDLHLFFTLEESDESLEVAHLELHSLSLTGVS